MPHYNFVDLTGQPFGRWIVLERAPNDARSRAQWWCRCSCGTVRIVEGTSLRQGNTISCGCWRNECTGVHRRKHGMRHTPEWQAWQRLKRQCSNPRANNYKNYGGRGIQVCEKWRTSFANFYADVGPRPSPQHSLDRYPDNNGNYEPGNVRWATDAMQRRNKRTNRMLTFEGRTLCVRDWADVIGIAPSTLQARLDAGWSVVHALSTPLLSRGQRYHRYNTPCTWEPSTQGNIP